MSPSGRRIETFIAPMPGCRSAHVAMKLAELADVRGQLEAATRSLNPEQLAWRPSPDSNSIAMLLTHVALVEVHMSQVGLKGEPHNHVHRPPRPDGSYRVFDRRWVLHHLVDHLAQHMGQVQVLKRQWLAAHPEAVA